MCRGRAQQLGEQLQGVYLRDKNASETVRAGVLEALGLLVEVAPKVRQSCWPCHHKSGPHLYTHSVQVQPPLKRFLSIVR